MSAVTNGSVGDGLRLHSQAGTGEMAEPDPKPSQGLTSVVQTCLRQTQVNFRLCPTGGRKN